MKLTVLVDNNTIIDDYYLGEPAVSFYIEDQDKKILFDVGYSDIFIKNAEAMNIDLNQVDVVALSHGHNDHTLGMVHLKDKVDTKKMELIAHSKCFEEKYYGDMEIGSPFSKEEIREMFKYVEGDKPYHITDNLIYLGQIPRTNDFENKDPVGKVKEDGNLVDDYLVDDTAMVYRTEEGIFVITGCSHSGICNIIEYAKKVCDDHRVLGVIGGFHLLKENEQVEKTVEYLENCHMKMAYPCHCVSLSAKVKMYNKIPVSEVGVGMTLEI